MLKMIIDANQSKNNKIKNKISNPISMCKFIL